MTSQATQGGHTILVVDDDQEVQRMLRVALEQKGFRVETAGDGLAAVDFLKAGGRADLAILDLFMPTMDGWAALAQMQHLSQPPPVVVLSGTSEANITPRIFREGVQAFIGKPFQLEVLVNTCRELIATARGGTLVADRRQLGPRRTLTLPVTITDLGDLPLQPGRLVNLSAHGAQVELKDPLPPGQRVRVVYLPEAGDGLSVEGTVRWWRHPDSAAPTSHGIAFTGVSAEQQQMIRVLAALE